MSRGIERFGGAAASLALLAGPTVEAAPANAELQHGEGTIQAIGQVAFNAESVDEAGTPPNVIVILMDDLSKDVMKYMPNERKLIRNQGVELKEYYVEQSTCCPSRATIYSGKYSHNHGVIGNDAPMGGYSQYQAKDEGHDLPNWMAANPVIANNERTLMGKTFNDYPLQGQLGHVITGWNDFLAPARGQPYDQTGYTLNQNGTVDVQKHPEFLDNVLGDHLLQEIADGGDEWSKGGQFAVWASYAPHTPYASEKRYHRDFKHVSYPRTPAFGERDTLDKWGSAGEKHALNAQQVRSADEIYRKRVRAVQTVDRYIPQIINELAVQGALQNTYVIFTSDNGYHNGEHNLSPGKYTQFQTDINVPLDIRGPGIPAGKTINALVGNTDIAPTIADMTNTRIPAGISVDGTSILPILEGHKKSVRDYYLIGRGKVPLNHNGPHNTREPAETEVDTRSSAILNDFVGVVSQRFKYVQYSHDGKHRQEFYDRRKDPYELRNLLGTDKESAAKLTRKQRVELHRARRALNKLKDCAGDECLV
jgi:arylsulfatase A-like enzyme